MSFMDHTLEKQKSIVIEKIAGFEKGASLVLPGGAFLDTRASGLIEATLQLAIRRAVHACATQDDLYRFLMTSVWSTYTCPGSTVADLAPGAAVYGPRTTAQKKASAIAALRCTDVSGALPCSWTLERCECDMIDGLVCHRMVLAIRACKDDGELLRLLGERLLSFAWTGPSRYVADALVRAQ